MQKMAFWTLPLELTSHWKLVFAFTSISIAHTCCPFPLVCCAHLLAFLPTQTALISHMGPPQRSRLCIERYPQSQRVCAVVVGGLGRGGGMGEHSKCADFFYVLGVLGAHC